MISTIEQGIQAALQEADDALQTSPEQMQTAMDSLAERMREARNAIGKLPLAVGHRRARFEVQLNLMNTAYYRLAARSKYLVLR